MEYTAVANHLSTLFGLADAVSGIENVIDSIGAEDENYQYYFKVLRELFRNYQYVLHNLATTLAPFSEREEEDIFDILGWYAFPDSNRDRYWARTHLYEVYNDLMEDI